MIVSDFEQADGFAESYDSAVQEHGWNSPQVLFELTRKYLKPEDRLLDLGIGTGLSAIPFVEAGVSVSGVDGSGKMLEQCESKGVTVELKQHDIRSAPIPFENRNFDHVIACGVFHLVGKMDVIFAEVHRLMRPGGAFAFTIEPIDLGRPSEGTLIDPGVLEISNEKSGVVSYRHGLEMVAGLLNRFGFSEITNIDYVAYPKTDWADERSFRAIVARKTRVAAKVESA